MKRIILAALVGVLVSGPVWGKDAKGKFNGFGAASIQCTKYLGLYGKSELRKTPKGGFSYRASFGNLIGWLQGYATRVNETTPGGAGIYDMDAVDMAAWVASFCRDNPKYSLLNAMRALTESRLKGKK